MKKIMFLLIAAAVLTLSVTACSSNSTQAEPAPAVTSAPTAVIAEGRLLPVNWLEQSFDLPGTVETVMVQDGEKVSAGQLLASLAQSPDAALAVARAEQEFLSAQQALDSLEKSAALTLAQGQLNVLTAQETLEDAQAAYDANDSAENKAQLDIATASLALAEEELTRLEEGEGIDGQLLEIAQARFNTAKAAFDSAQAQVNRYQLTSNTAGTIVDLNLQPGQKITAGVPVMTVADLSNWIVKTDNLSETQITSITLGDTVSVVLDALPEVKLTGVVTHINNRFEEKRGDITFTVTISIKEIDPAMRWGMTAAVYFQP